MKELSASLEDYLEIICNLLKDKETLRAVDISKELNISRASVSEALVKLADKNLIIYNGHGISITTEGNKKAREIISKHCILEDFFEQSLGLDKKEAEDNACRIEHVISDELFKRIKLFQLYCQNNKEIITNFKERLKHIKENE